MTMRFIFNSIIISVIGIILTVSLGGCKKFIEVTPPTNAVTEAVVFNNDLTATAAVTGLYSTISNAGFTSTDLLTFSKLAGLSADELSLWSGANMSEKAYYQNALFSTFGTQTVSNAGPELWNTCYPYLYKCNQIVEGVSKSNSLSPFVSKQLVGEVKFLRAFLYFYLVNLYGDVPLVTGLDPKVNRKLPRTSKADVYSFIIADLKDAQGLLSTDFLSSDLKTSTVERIRPTKWAATALLARAYLYVGDYAKAETEATSVINQTSLFNVSTTPLNNVFLKNSNEAIWQLQPVTQSWNTLEARLFDLNASPAGFSYSKSVSISNVLYNAFEPGDDRKVIWMGSYNDGSSPTPYYFPAKYKAGFNNLVTAANPGALTEYEMVLRLAEQFLIRAEARARQGNVSDAVADLNIIRTRARAIPTITVPNPLPDLPITLSPSQTVDAVIQERRVELFTEWGHRWLDLKRTEMVDAVMGAVTPGKGGTWQTTDQLYPIPISDLKYNNNLTQNAGY